MGRFSGGVLATALGASVAAEAGLLESLSFADDGERLDFGELEPLVALIQETAPDELLVLAAKRLRAGLDVETLVAATALANARTFGGHDYIGYHGFMALVPALEMTRRLSADRAALPVLKVLHRNATRIRSKGGRRRERLRVVTPSAEAPSSLSRSLLASGRDGGYDRAEADLATASSPEAGFQALQPLVRDNIDVHQVVLAYRSWDMLRLAGAANAEVLMRAAMRQCIDRDTSRRRKGHRTPSIRALLPEIAKRYELNAAPKSMKTLDDEAFARLARVMFSGSREQAAEAVGAALASGVSPEVVGEAMSYAAALLLLHDPGRSDGVAGKPKGSVHGASTGVHACDSANAWRGIAATTPPTNARLSLVTGAWHTAGQSGRMQKDEPFHAVCRQDAGKVKDADLLPALREAVSGRHQRNAAALAERYAALHAADDAAARRLADLLINFAIEDDGALHHEKFFHTATSEFARTRPAFRWVHLTALARVAASGHGFSDPCVQRARELLRG